MKTVNKWYLLSSVLFLTFSGFAQNNAFEDDIFSPRRTRTEQTEETRQAPVQQQTTTTTNVATTIPGTSARRVDEYNRRFVDEEVFEEGDSIIEDINGMSYTERIIRFHNPAKIAIVGADNAEIIPDGEGGFIIDFQQPVQQEASVNVNLGFGWGSPWGWNSWAWNDPWWGSPWGNPWWGRPSFGWGWNSAWGWNVGWGWNIQLKYPALAET